MAQMEFIALKSLKKIAFAALTCVSLSLSSGTVFAGAAPTTPCDPQFMDALEARAWMEAQREIAQNQNLIVKPDSVLEYVCFEQILNTLGGNASFSDGGTVAAGTLSGELSQLVGTAASSYIKLNYSHTYLGGRTGINSTMDNWDGTVAGGTYNCNEMAKVWQAAKCLNIFDKPAHDGFFDFAWYVDNDPRQLPTEPDPLAACTVPALFSTRPQMAFNDLEEKYMLDPENPNDNTLYNVDNVVSYFGLIDPGQCGDPAIAGSEQGIPTGVQIKRSGFAVPQYEDHVCPNPGCYYDPQAQRCVNN